LANLAICFEFGQDMLVPVAGLTCLVLAPVIIPTFFVARFVCMQLYWLLQVHVHGAGNIWTRLLMELCSMFQLHEQATVSWGKHVYSCCPRPIIKFKKPQTIVYYINTTIHSMNRPAQIDIMQRQKDMYIYKTSSSLINPKLFCFKLTLYSDTISNLFLLLFYTIKKSGGHCPPPFKISRGTALAPCIQFDVCI